MSEPTAEYIAMIDAANRAAAYAGEAQRAEAQQVRGMADWLLGIIADMNFPHIPAHQWRAALAQVAERLGEVTGG